MIGLQRVSTADLSRALVSHWYTIGFVMTCKPQRGNLLPSYDCKNVKRNVNAHPLYHQKMITKTTAQLVACRTPETETRFRIPIITMYHHFIALILSIEY